MATANVTSSLAFDKWAEALTSLWSGWNSSPLVWSLLIYSAVGPGAVLDLLQQHGQRETLASESNVILCMESVFTAVCAYVSTREIAGGGIDCDRGNIGFQMKMNDCSLLYAQLPCGPSQTAKSFLCVFPNMISRLQTATAMDNIVHICLWRWTHVVTCIAVAALSKALRKIIV